MASELAGVVEAEGLVVGLVGPLGAGKTEWVKGLAEGLGIAPGVVTSPSFVVANEYRGRGGRRLVHADFFRVESSAELESAGLRDWLEPGAVVAAEWSDRFPEALPGDRLDVELLPETDGARVVTARAGGPVSGRALARWRERLGGVAPEGREAGAWR
jgi:tRNA threonylcarbamoyladenosine biosynthesis protein TsaE